MTGPTLRKRQLSMELRRLRNTAGISRQVAADEIACSPTKITHFESGRSSPHKAELRVLLQLYGASSEEQTALEALRLEAGERGWWSTAKLPELLADYIGLEDDAISFRAVALELIPGLLQTEDYAREVHRLAVNTVAPDQIERWVAARMRRQHRLTGPRPLRFSAVVSEAALRRCAGHAPVAHGQLKHLIRQANLPHVDLRILPFSAGLHPSTSGTIVLLSFPEDVLPDVAYQEYAIGGHLIDEPAIVTRMHRIFAALQDQALGTEESIALISELLRDASCT